MTTDRKIIKNKIAMLELAKQLRNVSRACNIRIRPTCNRGLSRLRCLRRMSWGIVAAVVLCVCQGVPGWALVSSQKSGNAAHVYRRAFEEIARLPEGDAALPGPNEPLPHNDKSEQIVSRLGPAMKWLHEATAKQECDWENDLHRKGTAAAFPHLAKSRDLVGRAILRARYYWQSGRRDQAIEDVRAVIVLARHVGNEGRTGLVGLTERYKIEQTVVDVLRQWITDARSARSLDGLCRLALQPEGNLPKIGLLLERETLLPWTRRLVTASNLTAEEQKWRDQFFGRLLAQRGVPWILQKLYETEVHYTEVGDLLDLPIDQFTPKFRQYLRKLDGAGNPFSQMAIVECPGIPGAYLQSRNLRAQWTKLQEALSVFQGGPGAASGSAAEAAPADPKTAVGVDRLVRRLERAFNDKDRETLLSCFANDAILIDPPEKGTRGSQVFSGKSLKSLLDLTLTHPMTAAAEFVMIDGTGFFTLRQDDDVADLLLTSAIRVKSVRDMPTTIGWCDRRFVGTVFENQRWRMCFSFPCFVESRVVVTEVRPGTQAARLGMRKGDVIMHHLQMAIFDSEQLLWRAKMFYNEPAERQFRVLVRRDNRLLPLLFGPGEMGVKTQSCFEGRVDTITLKGVQAERHPVAKTIARYHRALQRRDVTGVMATLCPDGFVFCHGLPSAETKRVITSRNAAQTVPQELRLLAKRLKPETIDISDTRAIIYGDLALAGWHVSARKPNGDSVSYDVVACLVGNEDRWTIVGMPWQNDHVLGL